jgi:cellulose synthase/poly-beta-1,6-N-acetylglucosamine synthase-like glycosyltransferase
MNVLLQRLRAWWAAWRPVPSRRPPTTAAPPSTSGEARPALHAPLQACATVVIPALNEAAHIAQVVRHARADPATAQVIVVDDSSIDDTAALAREAGAEVITSTMLGKGASMRDGALAARQDVVVYLTAICRACARHRFRPLPPPGT